MIRLKRGAERPLHAIDLRRGVILHARTLDSFALAEIAAAIEAEWEALAVGAPLRPWGLSAEIVAQAAESDYLKRILKSWMIAVLTAERSVERMEGVEDEDGQPASPSFDVFALLFSDSDFELFWRRGSSQIGQLWANEGNVSGRGLSGVSTGAMNSAPAVVTSIPPAPEASPSLTMTEASASAPSSSTPPEPAPAPSPGA